MLVEVPDWSPGADFLVSLKCFGISALGEPDIEYPGEVHLGHGMPQHGMLYQSTL